MTDTVSRAVEIAQIINVVLDNSSARYSDPEAVHVALDLDKVTIQTKKSVRDCWFLQSDEENASLLLCIRFDFGIRIMLTNTTDQAEIVEEREFARIEASFVGQYLLTGEQPASETVMEFARTVGMLNIWPYWREHAHDLARRMGWSNVIVPMFKLRFRDSE
ncbi:MAG: hypothetical protein HQM06_14935 [Magnetococcales bacterium]|nr:hypothetical protein [Magnetococcales bacterium]